MALWMVRCGKYGEREQFNLDNSVVSIGWEGLPDLRALTEKSELTALLVQQLPDKKPKTISNWAGQVWTFAKVIQPGDLVAMPLKSSPAIQFGKVIGDYGFRPDFMVGAQHNRKVEWLRSIPRTAIDPDLLFSFGAIMTVCKIEHHDAERRIRALLSAQSSQVDLENVITNRTYDLQSSDFKCVLAAEGAILFGPHEVDSTTIARAAREVRQHFGKVEVRLFLVPPVQAKKPPAWDFDPLRLVERLHDGFSRGLIEIGQADPSEHFGGGGQGSDWRAVLVEIGRRAIRFLAGVDLVFQTRENEITDPIVAYHARIAEELLFGTRAVTVAMRADYYGMDWTIATCIEGLEDALNSRPSEHP